MFGGLGVQGKTTLLQVRPDERRSNSKVCSIADRKEQSLVTPLELYLRIREVRPRRLERDVRDGAGRTLEAELCDQFVVSRKTIPDSFGERHFARSRARNSVGADYPRRMVCFKQHLDRRPRHQALGKKRIQSPGFG